VQPTASVASSPIPFERVLHVGFDMEENVVRERRGFSQFATHFLLLSEDDQAKTKVLIDERLKRRAQRGSA
jgi:hypothetical protein